MSDKIRILIADDHTIFRSGLNLLLSSEVDLEVVGEAKDGMAAVEMAASLHPDVVLMDVGMPGLNGLDATRQIRARLPEVNILVLTMHRSDEYFFQMLEAGAAGYLLKGAETNELINAVRAVARGDVFLYPSMARRLVQEYLSQSPSQGSAAAHLTEREREILKLIAEGFSNGEIADRLVISPSTVHSHRANLMRKLELGSRHELVQYARQKGLIGGS
ncbi:MAG: DNA-binding response regulator [Chloroflexi bacterium RBG_19FT_COMBO_62_14]|nr:MAG: DNA-binding response regulator [Chloroflexi bacterium RBG_19FT_COMBO_62_14]